MEFSEGTYGEIHHYYHSIFRKMARVDQFFYGVLQA